MKEEIKRCVLCNAEIPKGTRDELMESGYSGVYDNFERKSYIFCPLHYPKQIADYISKNRIGFKVKL